jgi:hypothetical protein
VAGNAAAAAIGKDVEVANAVAAAVAVAAVVAARKTLQVYSRCSSLTVCAGVVRALGT